MFLGITVSPFKYIYSRFCINNADGRERLLAGFRLFIFACTIDRFTSNFGRSFLISLSGKRQHQNPKIILISG